MSNFRHRTKIGARAPLSIAVLVLAPIILSLSPRGSAAHHILGIPHYAYDERYPQVPVLTFKTIAGPHEVEMTGYPGRPAPGEQCFLNVYIRRLDDGASFGGVVSLEVLRDRMVGSDPSVYGPAQAGLEEGVFKFYPRFEAESNYTIRISFEAEGAPWVIELPMVVGEPGSPWAVLTGVFGGLATFVIVIRAVRIKTRRRTGLEGTPEPPEAALGGRTSI